MKKIRYEFITEEIVEIEISDEWGEKLKSVKREQWKLDKREERHSVSQQDLLKALYEDGMSKQEYADSIGVSPSAISHRLETIRKN